MEMKYTTYKSTGEPPQKMVRTTGLGAIKRKPEDMQYADKFKIQGAGKRENGRPDNRECLKCGKLGHLAKIFCTYIGSEIRKSWV